MPAERLRRVLSPPAGLPPSPFVPRLLPAALVLMGLGLVPWIGWLAYSLPRATVADHWRLAWTGFDVGLALGLGATGVLILRRSPLAAIAATITGTALACDAWFDVLTSRGGEVWVAVAMALVVELPLAFVFFRFAVSVERVFRDARPYLLAAGFRVENRRLVAPRDAALSIQTVLDRHPAAGSSSRGSGSNAAR